MGIFFLNSKNKNLSGLDSGVCGRVYGRMSDGFGLGNLERTGVSGASAAETDGRVLQAEGGESSRMFVLGRLRNVAAADDVDIPASTSFSDCQKGKITAKKEKKITIKPCNWRGGKLINSNCGNIILCPVLSTRFPHPHNRIPIS